MSSMLDLLRSLEWAGGSDADGWCPTCGGAGRHEPGCRLDRAIRGAVSVEPLRPPLTTEEKARALGYARNASAWVDADGVWCSDALIDVRWTEHLIRGQQRAREAASEPTVDEMAREMGWRSSLDVPTHWHRDGWPGPMSDDGIRTLYHEHKAKQIDATLAGKRVGPWLTPPAPKVYEASGPPTDPSALAAWLYARIGPGVWAEWVVRGNPRPSKEAVTGCDLDDGAVWLDLATSGRARIPGEPSDRLHVVRLLNPDGTVLWEAK